MPGGPRQGRKLRKQCVIVSGIVFRARWKSCIEPVSRGATRRRGFPEDDGGWGYIRGIISCLVGFVGGKQSAQGCCRQTYYRRISYIHIRSPIALSKLLSLPQRRSRRDCSLRLFSRAPSVNSASLVHCDLFPKPRTTRAHPAWRIECTQPASCRLHGSCTYVAFHYCL